MIAVFLLKEQASWNQWLAIVIASLGLLLIALGQQHSHIPLLGLILVLCSAFSWACGNIVIKRMGSINPIGLVVWGNILTPLWFYYSLSKIQVGKVSLDWHALTWRGLGAAAFLAYFATIIGYGLWIYLLTRYPAAKISPLSLWVPVISMIFANIF